MITSADLPPPMNHVLVDFENVHEIDPAVIGTKSVSFTLLLGARQMKLDTGLVEKMLAHASTVELIRLTGTGKNALDFALAYYLGRLVLADPKAYFHVISKDKGYDPLIEHLRSRHVNARRHDDFTSLTFSYRGKEAPVTVKTELVADVSSEPEDVFSRVLQRLRKNVANRPKKKSTLLSHLKSNLGKDATANDAATMLEKLRKAGYLKIGEKDAVTYTV